MGKIFEISYRNSIDAAGVHGAGIGPDRQS